MGVGGDAVGVEVEAAGDALVEIGGERQLIESEFVVALHECFDEGIFEARGVSDKATRGQLIEVAGEAVEHAVGDNGSVWVAELATQHQTEDVLLVRATISRIEIAVQQQRKQVRQLLQRSEKLARIQGSREREHVVAIDYPGGGLAQRENVVVTHASNAATNVADVAHRLAVEIIVRDVVLAGDEHESETEWVQLIQEKVRIEQRRRDERRIGRNRERIDCGLLKRGLVEDGGLFVEEHTHQRGDTTAERMTGEAYVAAIGRFDI